MAGSLNKVQLIGNLGKDPEVRQGQDGSKFATFTLATNERWKDRQTNEVKDKTEWHRVVVFNDKLADVCERYLKKGAKVYIEGQLQTRKWTDNTGVEKYTTEVVLSRFRGEMVMLDGRADGFAQVPDNSNASSIDQFSDSSFDLPGKSPARAASAGQDFDDDIPF
ncbi:MAG: single-stranded DNA-binding protein [Alphaproteobacteria bacterium]|nr:single-stranded DNA-binding protein [Alphaproteobacteria bacterium]